MYALVVVLFPIKENDEVVHANRSHPCSSTEEARLESIGANGPTFFPGTRNTWNAQGKALLTYLDDQQFIMENNCSTPVGGDCDAETGTPLRPSVPLTQFVKMLFLELLISDPTRLRTKMARQLSESFSLYPSAALMENWCCSEKKVTDELLQISPPSHPNTLDGVCGKNVERMNARFSDIHQLIRQAARFFLSHVLNFLRCYVLSLRDVEVVAVEQPAFTWADWIPYTVTEETCPAPETTLVGDRVTTAAAPPSEEVPSISFKPRDVDAPIVKSYKRKRDEVCSIGHSSHTANGSQTNALSLLLMDTYTLWRRSSCPLLTVQRNCSACGPYYTYSTGSPGIDIALSSSSPSNGCEEEQFSISDNRRNDTLSSRGAETFAGGCRSGLITEVFGVAGSGKTQLLLQLLCTESARLMIRQLVGAALQDEFPTSFGAAMQEVWQTATPIKDGNHSTSEPTTSAAPLLYDALVEYATWDKLIYRETIDSASKKVLVYLVAEDMPLSRLQQIASGCASSALKRYFDIPEPTNSRNGVDSIHQDRAFLTASPLSRGRFPAAVIERVHYKVTAQLTTERILSHILIYRIKNGLEELHRLLSPAGVDNPQTDTSPCLTLAGLIHGRETTKPVGMTEIHPLHGGSNERGSAGLIALDSLAAVVQQSATEAFSGYPTNRGSPPSHHAGSRRAVDDDQSDEEDELEEGEEPFPPSASKVTHPRENHQAELVKSIGERFLQLCRRYGVAVVVSNQIRAVYQNDAQREETELNQDHDINLSENTDTNLVVDVVGSPPSCRLATSSHWRKVEYVSTPLGLSWAVIPHVRVQLRRESIPSTVTRRSTLVRWLQIISSPYSAVRRTYFQITNQGVVDEKDETVNESFRK